MVRGGTCVFHLKIRGELARLTNTLVAKHVLTQLTDGKLLYDDKEADGDSVRSAGDEQTKAPERAVTATTGISLIRVASMSPAPLLEQGQETTLFEVKLSNKGRAALAFSAAAGERDLYLFGWVPKLFSSGFEAALADFAGTGKGKVHAVRLLDDGASVVEQDKTQENELLTEDERRHNEGTTHQRSLSATGDETPPRVGPAAGAYPSILPITAPPARQCSDPADSAPGGEQPRTPPSRRHTACTSAERTSNQVVAVIASPVFTPCQAADGQGDAAPRHKRMREDAPDARDCALNLTAAWAASAAGGSPVLAQAGTFSSFPILEALDTHTAEKVVAATKAAALAHAAKAKAEAAAEQAKAFPAALQPLAVAAELAAQQHESAIRACEVLKERLESNRREREEIEVNMAAAARARADAESMRELAAERERAAQEARDKAGAEAENLREEADAAFREVERLLAIAEEGVTNAARNQLRLRILGAPAADPSDPNQLVQLT